MSGAPDFRSEMELYSFIVEYLRKLGYTPILGDKELPIPIGNRIFYPDVSGRRGIEVCAVEAKDTMDETSVVEAFVQAEMYQKGCTHVYVAFPKSAFESCDPKFQSAVLERCQKEGLGLLLVSRADTNPLFPPVPSAKIDYDILGKVHVTIDHYSRSDIQEIYNTLPEIIKDICVLLPIPKAQGQFENELCQNHSINWRKKSGARGIKMEDAIKNRVKSTIESAKVLGLIIERDGMLSRTASGEYFVVGLGSQVGGTLPSHCKAFLQAILLKSGIIMQAVQTLRREKEMYFDYLVCEKCWHKEWMGWPQRKENLFCPKCSSLMKTCLTYETQTSYYPLKFAEELEILKFKTHDKLRIRRVFLPI